MIISRTPFRISFFGGGTDYRPWVERHGGAVLSTSFDKYCYISCRMLPPFFDHRHRITYSALEQVREIGEIRHPAIRAVLARYLEGSDEGLEIHCDADLPARSGLGSSSSFVVGLLHALEALRGRRVSQEWLAKEAIRYEQEILAENVGSQDQVATAVGGLNIVHFSPGGNFRVEPFILPQERKRDLGRRLLLFFTGFARFSSQVAAAQLEVIEKKAALLGRLRAMVDEAADILTAGGDLRPFGELLHEAWLNKRALSPAVSSPEIDGLYEKARAAGAVGGKLLGAGGGGFMLLFAEPEKQAAVRQALAGLIHVPFHFESGGSRIIYYQG